mmetsp:Transcript_12743/g.27360  ORF Transcript_12743/g.27360 Transcript_12743/m.27360 type:complete len:202 (-) Transcript_12743:956-1561(-)
MISQMTMRLLRCRLTSSRIVSSGSTRKRVLPRCSATVVLALVLSCCHVALVRRWWESRRRLTFAVPVSFSAPLWWPSSNGGTSSSSGRRCETPRSSDSRRTRSKCSCERTGRGRASPTHHNLQDDLVQGQTVHGGGQGDGADQESTMGATPPRRSACLPSKEHARARLRRQGTLQTWTDGHAGSRGQQDRHAQLLGRPKAV